MPVCRANDKGVVFGAGTKVAKRSRCEIVNRTRHKFVTTWSSDMYRIHFNRDGALGTERAVLEIGTTGFRWQLRPAGSRDIGEDWNSLGLGHSNPIAHRHLKSRRFVMKDYAERWPAYERRRKLQRWKAEQTALIQLVAEDIRQRLGLSKPSPVSPGLPNSAGLVQVNVAGNAPQNETAPSTTAALEGV